MKKYLCFNGLGYLSLRDTHPDDESYQWIVLVPNEENAKTLTDALKYVIDERRSNG